MWWYHRSSGPLPKSTCLYVCPSLCQSVRWLVSDVFVMLPLLGDVWPWTYGHGSGLVFTTVPRQFLGCGPKEKMTIGTIIYQERPEEDEIDEDSLRALLLLLLQTMPWSQSGAFVIYNKHNPHFHHNPQIFPI